MYRRRCLPWRLFAKLKIGANEEVVLPTFPACDVYFVTLVTTCRDASSGAVFVSCRLSICALGACTLSIWGLSICGLSICGLSICGVDFDGSRGLKICGA